MRFFDGNISHESNLLAEVSGFYVNEYNLFPSNVSSSSNKLLVTFTSDEHFIAEGFKAKIHVEALTDLELSTDACSIIDPCKGELFIKVKVDQII